MNAVHILNVISSIVPSLCVFAQTAPIMVDNVYLPYVDDERYLNATIDYPYGSSVYHFQLSLYVDSEIINIELDMNHSWINGKILDQNFKHSENYVDVIKTVIEKKIHEEIQIECEQELSYED
jgi:DNA-binding GntR family transcriptional regulator